ncbi:hypothetical protein AAVH_38808 [Aphelenchoides avenae]|nr:hypothetical protein AAVH_38808 [Aphelenchus avenae]
MSPTFQLTAEKLDVKPEECIFIDDSPFNCKGAESVGYTAIHLADDDSLAAVKRLEELLELKLT